jgi:hypothetical protein
MSDNEVPKPTIFMAVTYDYYSDNNPPVSI